MKPFGAAPRYTPQKPGSLPGQVYAAITKSKVKVALQAV
ncbi:hypothetical protein C7460_11315 [Marinoscillum furvescens DSM 4134]|uniref:Uncharacterized protein n=1 Tax=Marinoscillum furvescens DSM 4134 TaxID=1122208 RepID=A0A3D9L1J1_MARFU|nr:hypothetical protein C7460_11315 [Marinoscillum furvescens DSM 4134]